MMITQQKEELGKSQDSTNSSVSSGAGKPELSVSNYLAINKIFHKK